MRDLLPLISDISLITSLTAPFFLFLFLAIVFWTFKQERKKIYEYVSKMPLEDR